VTATDQAVDLVHTAARAASDKLAEDILAFDVSDQLVITDAFVLCSAGNDRQVRSIVEEIEDKMREAGAKPVRRNDWCHRLGLGASDLVEGNVGVPLGATLGVPGRPRVPDEHEAPA
jgi:hypothetical protein